MKFALAFSSAIVLFASGCANIQTTTPVQRDVERSRTYNMEFDKTWNRAVDWFADHNVSIEKIEKSSGLISAKYLLPANQNDVDCGELKVVGTMGKTNIVRYGALNLTVRPQAEKTTKVNVNFFGQMEVSSKDLWDARPVGHISNCVSTGNIEKEVLNYIGS